MRQKVDQLRYWTKKYWAAIPLTHARSELNPVYLHVVLIWRGLFWMIKTPLDKTSVPLPGASHRSTACRAHHSGAFPTHSLLLWVPNPQMRSEMLEQCQVNAQSCCWALSLRQAFWCALRVVLRLLCCLTSGVLHMQSRHEWVWHDSLWHFQLWIGDCVGHPSVIRIVKLGSFSAFSVQTTKVRGRACPYTFRKFSGNSVRVSLLPLIVIVTRAFSILARPIRNLIWAALNYSRQLLHCSS